MNLEVQIERLKAALNELRDYLQGAQALERAATQTANRVNQDNLLLRDNINDKNKEITRLEEELKTSREASATALDLIRRVYTAMTPEQLNSTIADIRDFAQHSDEI